MAVVHISPTCLKQPLQPHYKIAAQSRGFGNNNKLELEKKWKKRSYFWQLPYSQGVILKKGNLFNFVTYFIFCNLTN